ncbi:hypothetical protein ADIWIN_1461 [Winogradskyella psychrotolerans RS-3]|uniref:Macro domain-containing protein n=1 Tax=Winogradskyella psychrotolerans RS-3 TaxID=641526 RepID=S7VTM6_9FLAO|nr:hypothetical protein ADIWIN_1461 [Winogradskyella psychrotolerans RS-3]
MEKFLDTYEEKGIKSIAFPMLGAQNGGLSEEDSLNVMKKYLSQAEIPVEIYSYVPNLPDDIFPNLKLAFLNQDISELKKIIGIPTKQIETIMSAIKSDKINNMVGLHQLRGIGEKGIQKCYSYASNENVNKIQITLFKNE